MTQDAGFEDDEEQHDPLVNWMRARGIPVTRENYLGLAYPGGPPEEWTAELEAQLPEALRRPLPDPDDELPFRCMTWQLKDVDEELERERKALMARLLSGNWKRGDA